MDALVERDLVYTTDFEESEAFFRKNWEEAEEELRFQPRIETIKEKPTITLCKIYHIDLQKYNTIRICMKSDELTEFDTIRILNARIAYLVDDSTVGETVNRVVLLRLFHLGYVDISYNEVVIKIPKYFANNCVFNVDQLSSDYTIECYNTYEFSLDDELKHNTTFSVELQAYDTRMYLQHSLYNLIIYISKINAYIYKIEEINHENIPLCLSIYRESDNVLLAVVPYDELIVSEAYNIACYECNLEKFVGNCAHKIRVQMLDAPEFRTYVYAENNGKK